MKATDFSKYITDFFMKHLTHERGASSNTISSYRDTFILLSTFMEQKKRIKLNKLMLSDITQSVIIEFLNWLQEERNCSASTRNQRLAVIRSFFSYIQYRNPEFMHECHRIMSIKPKKVPLKIISYLTIEGIKLLLEQPDITIQKGRRDLALLSLMYDTGARVQETIDLTANSCRLTKPYTLQIKGKGNKARIVPLMEEQVEILKNYMDENKLSEPFAGDYLLFCNSRKQKFTRAGITNIFLKYVKMARERKPELIPKKLSCHSLRHSKAMHLLQAGVNLVYIRDILGHVSVQTTELYAKADAKLKRDALEKAYVNVQPSGAATAIWIEDPDLKNWLINLGK
jgi:site-specific recombinase XerD